jgi:hypothetical protein
MIIRVSLQLLFQAKFVLDILQISTKYLRQRNASKRSKIIGFFFLQNLLISKMKNFNNGMRQKKKKAP